MVDAHAATIPVYRFGPYQVVRSGRVLERNGEVLPVSPKVLLCLLVLLEASGRVVTKAQLFAVVWPDSFVEDSNLTQNIWVLRKLLAADYPEGSPIETVARWATGLLRPSSPARRKWKRPRRSSRVSVHPPHTQITARVHRSPVTIQPGTPKTQDPCRFPSAGRSSGDFRSQAGVPSG
jgi:hypothetical protein